jgi:hypothetical protein
MAVEAHRVVRRSHIFGYDNWEMLPSLGPFFYFLFPLEENSDISQTGPRCYQYLERLSESTACYRPWRLCTYSSDRRIQLSSAVVNGQNNKSCNHVFRAAISLLRIVEPLHLTMSGTQ